MTPQETLTRCTRIIHDEFAISGVSVSDIVLFGSRARGEARKDSDWDLLISTGRELSFPEKAAMRARILTRLAEFGIDADLIIKSENRVVRERDDVGLITHYALKEGMRV